MQTRKRKLKEISGGYMESRKPLTKRRLFSIMDLIQSFGEHVD
jgi:hypothetical protein